MTNFFHLPWNPQVKFLLRDDEKEDMVRYLDARK
jgi:hypothetical protein